MRNCLLVCSTLLLLTSAGLHAQTNAAQPGVRVLMDAHNCYPYEGQWNDRIDRALSGGVPLAIEQDLYRYTDPVTHRGQLSRTNSHSRAKSPL